MDAPGQVRHSDPITAHAAAASIHPGSMRWRLLQAHAEHPEGLTDEEAAGYAGISLGSEYATRCSELKRWDLLVDTLQARRGESGVERMIREITPAGRLVLRQESRTERPGRPDRYVDLRRSRAMAEDQARRSRAAAEQKRLRTTDRIPRGTLRVRFGENICRRCDGTGGSLLDACLRCGGLGIAP